MAAKSKETYSKIQKLLEFTIDSLGISVCLGAIVFTFIAIQNSTLIDFEIYYKAGDAILKGNSPYQFYGDFRLPFQYFPWAGWLFIPFAWLPMQTAWLVYAGVNILLLYLSITILVRLLPGNKEYDRRSRIFYVFFTSLMMSLLAFVVGQISIVLLFICALIIKLIHDKKPEAAGLLTPFLLIKPHLMLIFVPYTLVKGGVRYIAYSVLGAAILAGFATVQNHDRGTEMINIIRLGQDRGDALLWGFSTLPGALELKNWRVMNFYFAVPSLIASIFILKKFGKLPLHSQLSYSLALSLFSAPYSFAYDFPLLVPALIVLSNAQKNRFAILWICAAFLPILLQFQGQTYILIFTTMILITLELMGQNNQIGRNDEVTEQ